MLFSMIIITPAALLLLPEINISEFQSCFICLKSLFVKWVSWKQLMLGPHSLILEKIENTEQVALIVVQIKMNSSHWLSFYFICPPSISAFASFCRHVVYVFCINRLICKCKTYFWIETYVITSLVDWRSSPHKVMTSIANHSLNHLEKTSIILLFFSIHLCIPCPYQCGCNHLKYSMLLSYALHCH